jgi:hypothetical protein
MQPALFLLHTSGTKIMSCCLKKGKNNTHKHQCPKDNNDNDCCGGNQCNPFFSQCPICAASGIITAKYYLPGNRFDAYISARYFTYDQFISSQYHSEILRPPQIV